MGWHSIGHAFQGQHQPSLNAGTHCSSSVDGGGVERVSCVADIVQQPLEAAAAETEHRLEFPSIKARHGTQVVVSDAAVRPFVIKLNLSPPGEESPVCLNLVVVKEQHRSLNDHQSGDANVSSSMGFRHLAFARLLFLHFLR